MRTFLKKHSEPQQNYENNIAQSYHKLANKNPTRTRSYSNAHKKKKRKVI
jgi:hypothetical protein